MVATNQRQFVLQRRQWRISGRVQGVGFRPFVHRLAQDHGLTGFVLNDTQGVIIEAQGPPAELDGFLSDVQRRKPEQAIVQNVLAFQLPLRADEHGFAIHSSANGHLQPPRAAIAPDLAICPDCLRELHDPRDPRHHHYGLINCTACGPRFSIIRAVPYDRANTTMAGFAMCERCRREYDDPNDRRFHAQPTACHACGPKVELVDPKGDKIPGDAITVAAERLLARGIVAIQGIGGFHLAVRADDKSAVDQLRQLKHRPGKPFAVMAQTLEDARRLVDLSTCGAALLTSPAAPIVLARRLRDAPIAAESIAPRNHRIGVLLAYTPIHHLLFDALGRKCPFLVMTSANSSDEPLVYTHEEAQAHLGSLCSAVLRHHRPIQRPVEDSVVLDTGRDRAPLLIRRSRGYVPTPIALPDECGLSSGICVGGELKNTIAVVREGEVILSEHLGDLENARTYAAFKRAVSDLRELFSVKPQWVAHDLHPSYVSTMFATQLAQSLKVPRVAVQHHHAHAAAVLAEHGRTHPALAVVCDGTGYGVDGTIWGGELLLADLKGFKRLAHLRPLLLPGGDAAAKQAWRCAVSLLLDAVGEGFTKLDILRQIVPDPDQIRFITTMLKGRMNCFVSTSAGRYFDAIAALLGIADQNQFEAQAAMALESAAASAVESRGGLHPNHPLFELRDSTGGHATQISFTPLVRTLLKQRQRDTAPAELAALFHEQFAAAWDAAIARAVEKTGVICVALSGGVFCNEILDRLLTKRLTDRGLHVLRHEKVPPNDGGLALGQAAVACARANTTAR